MTRKAWEAALKALQEAEDVYSRSHGDYRAASEQMEREIKSGVDRKTAFENFSPAEKRHDKFADNRWEARDALLKTPAPDAEAMLFKLDILAADMAEACVEDAERVACLRADARRLLAEDIPEAESV